MGGVASSPLVSSWRASVMSPNGASPGGTSPDDASPGGASPDGTSPDGTSPEGTSPGTSPGGTSLGGAPPGDASPGGASPGGASSGGTSPGGASPGGSSPGGTSTGGGSPGGSSQGSSETVRTALTNPFVRLLLRPLFHTVTNVVVRGGAIHAADGDKMPWEYGYGCGGIPTAQVASARSCPSPIASVAVVEGRGMRAGREGRGLVRGPQLQSILALSSQWPQFGPCTIYRHSMAHGWPEEQLVEWMKKGFLKFWVNAANLKEGGRVQVTACLIWPPA